MGSAYFPVNQRFFAGLAGGSDMSTQEQTFEDDTIDSPWPALGWIVLAAMVSVTAFLMAPLP